MILRVIYREAKKTRINTNNRGGAVAHFLILQLGQIDQNFRSRMFNF